MVGKLQPGTEGRIEVTDEFATLVMSRPCGEIEVNGRRCPQAPVFRSVATNAVAGRYVHFSAYASADRA